MTGSVFDIKEFGVHDGAGLRTTVFLKGCPLRCVWCHNPEGLTAKPQLLFRKNACKECGLCTRGCEHEDCQPFGRCLHICPDNLLTVAGKTYTPPELAERILKNRALLSTDGGVTFSGGEPLMQADFLMETASLLGDMNIAIETSGYADASVFERVLAVVDFVFFDLKIADEEAHKRFTGVSNKPILENFETLKKSGVPFVIRTPLIPKITDTSENITAIKALTHGLKHELLPYNPMAPAKYELLGIPYPYSSI